MFRFLSPVRLRRAEMSRRNRTAVEKNYLPDAVLSKLVEIYKSL